MGVEETLSQLDEKLDGLSEVATRTEANVKNIKEGFAQHQSYCREDMGNLWKITTGTGGHGERLKCMETKWRLTKRQSIAGGVGGGGVIGGLIWLILEYIVPFFKGG